MQAAYPLLDDGLLLLFFEGQKTFVFENDGPGLLGNCGHLWDLELVGLTQVPRDDVVEGVLLDDDPDDASVRDGTLLLGLYFAEFDQVEERGSLYFPEDGVFPVEPWACIHRHEELRLVRVRCPLIRHCNYPSVRELQSAM